MVLRMKDHMVSGMLRSRVQDIRTDSISDKAFEQARLLPSMHARVRDSMVPWTGRSMLSEYCVQSVCKAACGGWHASNVLQNMYA